MSWYALFVETGREEDVKKHIAGMVNSSQSDIQYELLIAKREMRERKNGVVTTVTKRVFPDIFYYRRIRSLIFIKIQRDVFICWGSSGITKCMIIAKEIFKMATLEKLG